MKDDLSTVKWRYLRSYAVQKMRLARLQQQKKEFVYLRGASSELGTTVQSGKNGDTTSAMAMQIMSSIERLEARINNCINSLCEVIQYIEESELSEKDKAILTCRFISGMRTDEIYKEIDEPLCSPQAMSKRIRRIIDTLPEPKKRP